MINVITGRSGSGKTAEIIRRIQEDTARGIPTLFVVPEQQEFITEQMAAKTLPPEAFRHFSVTTFSKMATTVFETLGGLTVPNVSYATQVSLLWQTLNDLDGSLTVFGNRKKNAALLLPLLTTLEDFNRFGVTPEELADAGSRTTVSKPLQRKLNDLSLICARYSQRLQAFHRGQAHSPLRRAAQALRTSDTRVFSGRRLYFDSFSYFTADETALLREVARQTDALTVALCMDPKNRDNEIFRDATETLSKLRQTATDLGQPFEEIPLSVPAASNAVLAAAEADLWEHRRSVPYPRNDDTVRLVCAPHPYAEAETAALHIWELVEKGMRFEDIAVIVRDTNAWSGILDDAFERYHIPYFMSEPVPLSQKMPVQFLLAALRAVASGFGTEDMIAIAKTGLCGITPEEAQLFTDYCETWKIHGQVFVSGAWTMNPDGFVTTLSERARHTLDVANRVRDILVPPLLSLGTALRGAATAADMCRALCEYLRHVDISVSLSSVAMAEWKDGRAREAFDTLRTGNAILETLNDVAAQLTAAVPMSITDFCTLLTVIFAGTSIRAVPQTRDCVMVGSANSLRTEKVRATLILGLNEGEFPQNGASVGSLSVQDKRELIELDFNHDYCTAARTNAAQEYYFLYRSVTRATEKLWFSYHAFNAEAEACFPSVAVSSLRGLFTELPERTFNPASLHKTIDFSEADAVTTVKFPGSVLGDTLVLSQSKLDSFAKCPYSYYVKYLLELQEPAEGDVNRADMGTFIHAILEKLIPTFVDAKTGRKVLPSTQEMNDRIRAIAKDYINKLQIPLPYMTAGLSHTFEKMTQVAGVMAEGIRKELMDCAFTPSAFEMAVGGDARSAPFSYLLSDNRKVVFKGVIDRLDTVRIGETTYFRVVDYKTGDKKFDLKKIAEGLDMQLPLYLSGLFDGKSVTGIPAGAYYLTAIEDGGKLTVKRSGFALNNADVTAACGDVTFAKGDTLLSEAAMTSLLDETRDRLLSVADRIYRGEFPKTPGEDACRFCPIAGSCLQAVRKHDN